jgi:hypothetical protein
MKFVLDQLDDICRPLVRSGVAPFEHSVSGFAVVEAVIPHLVPQNQRYLSPRDGAPGGVRLADASRHEVVSECGSRALRGLR